MVDAIDPARLDSLPADLRAAFEAQARALAETSLQLDIERKARLHRDAEKSDLEVKNSGLEAKNSDLAAENAFLKEVKARLEYLVHELRRARFGPRSEKLDPDQQQLAFEDIEIAIAEVQESVGSRAEALDETADETNLEHRQRRSRALPKELPRIEQVIEPPSIACPCGCGSMIKIGEDRSERLDVTPAQFRVIVTIRPRYACPKGRAGVTQAPAPARLIEAGLPTEAMIAQVIVSKYSEHLPLYRQAQVFARHGVAIERSTLADWVGRAAFHLAPIVERMAELLKRSGKLFMDETTAPVLDPGRGKTKTGYLWALARDDRPFGGTDPPGVVFRYAPGRGGMHAQEMLAGFDGVLQVDGFTGYNRLQKADRQGGSPLRLAYCWSHGRREVIKAIPEVGSPIGDEILQRIAGLYAIEKQIRGTSPDQRRAVRQQRAKPLVADLEAFIRAQRERLSPRSNMGRALAYLANHWEGLCVYLDDGRVEMDSNPVENLIRPLTLNRKNSLFAGHDEGAQNWARLASLVATCKLNGVEPFAYMKTTLEALTAGHR
ncbi:MAG: IS66 family transposase, partial [Xanthobacteraceae bacterium]